MTKEQAIQAMREGKKITHRYFATDEWMTIEHGNIITFEDGNLEYINDFFAIRTNGWDEGYSIIDR